MSQALGLCLTVCCEIRSDESPVIQVRTVMVAVGPVRKLRPRNGK